MGEKKKAKSKWIELARLTFPTPVRCSTCELQGTRCEIGRILRVPKGGRGLPEPRNPNVLLLGALIFYYWGA